MTEGVILLGDGGKEDKNSSVVVVDVLDKNKCKYDHLSEDVLMRVQTLLAFPLEIIFINPINRLLSDHDYNLCDIGRNMI